MDAGLTFDVPTRGASSVSESEVHPATCLLAFSRRGRLLGRRPPGDMSEVRYDVFFLARDHGYIDAWVDTSHWCREIITTIARVIEAATTAHRLLHAHGAIKRRSEIAQEAFDGVYR